MKKLMILFLWMGTFSLNAGAFNPPDEGMWLPMFVERLNYVDMQEMGLQLTPEELYSINNSSLKDAIVGLSGGGIGGFFCTGEIVSDKGLMFTNHHCGYNSINELSTPEHNYLKDGFWAYSLEEELPVKGLSASFLIKMDNVTDSIVPFLSDTMSESARSAKVSEISTRLENAATEGGKYNVTVKSFFGGNEYYRFVYETYNDVRFVGAPPSDIGKFGGDTDNWMWPRHTGDFSIFRVYMGPEGETAGYSEDNVPYKPKHHLPITLEGVEKGDFAMIWGYPGGTDRYITSYGIDYNYNTFNPAIIDIFGTQLEVWRKHMDSDPKIDLEYASSYASAANTWKYMIGMNRGIKNLNVYQRKKDLEEKFMNWVGKKESRKEKYGKALDYIEEGYEKLDEVTEPFLYSALAGMNASKAMSYAQQYGALYGLMEDKEERKNNKAAIQETANQLMEGAEEHYNNYFFETDIDQFRAMIKLYLANVQQGFWPEYLKEIVAEYKGNIDEMVNEIYEESIFTSYERTMDFLKKPKFSGLEDDPILQLFFGFRNTLMENNGKYNKYQQQINRGDRLFVDALRKMHPDRDYYPDANSTMRLTYGTVLDYYPKDAVHYKFYTTLEGVMEKEDPTDDEFQVPEKLKELYNKKDYGPYDEDGKLVVAFLTTNDITGGNSGSPVINAEGELIGIAFDGNWEAMSGDIIFETELQRCINVDIRYVLFIIDKFAGAKNLIEELTIVKEKPAVEKAEVKITVEEE
ncbi:MAG: S46 family peptidase [Bacteroidales bacterium]|nr:S46 family peptidase [Bacteroidales bacterium]MCF8377476.1 S46 family peptidase [Bacteroidales bacterium]MCF8401599.1 S46 family peptidase [Bacteroidales bacterium]